MPHRSENPCKPSSQINPSHPISSNTPDPPSKQSTTSHNPKKSTPRPLTSFYSHISSIPTNPFCLSSLPYRLRHRARSWNWSRSLERNVALGLTIVFLTTSVMWNGRCLYKVEERSINSDFLPSNRVSHSHFDWIMNNFRSLPSKSVRSSTKSRNYNANDPYIPLYIIMSIVAMSHVVDLIHRSVYLALYAWVSSGPAALILENGAGFVLITLKTFIQLSVYHIRTV